MQVVGHDAELLEDAGNKRDMQRLYSSGKYTNNKLQESIVQITRGL